MMVGEGLPSRGYWREATVVGCLNPFQEENLWGEDTHHSTVHSLHVVASHLDEHLPLDGILLRDRGPKVTRQRPVLLSACAQGKLRSSPGPVPSQYIDRETSFPQDRLAECYRWHRVRSRALRKYHAREI